VLRDRQEGTTRIVSGGGRPPSRDPAISSDGRFLLFSSSSPDLVDGVDANGNGEDVYSYDVRSSALARVSVDPTAHQLPRGESFAPAVSADGRYVAFASTAPLAGPADGRSEARALPNVYLRDTIGTTTTRVSVGRGGAPPDGASYDPCISGNGRVVVFVSEATNLVPGDRNQVADIFLYDADGGTISLISHGMGGGPANGPSGRPAISEDGQTIVFQSEASDVACADKCSAATRDFNLVHDVFALDRRVGTIQCLSCGDRIWMEASAAPATNATGTVLAFSSRHPVDRDDMDNDFDLFVRALDPPALTKRH
jgi:Tol biopolymer transport system component